MPAPHRHSPFTIQHSLLLATRHSLFAVLLFLAGCTSVGGPTQQPSTSVTQAAGPQGSEDKAAGRRQLWLIPSPQAGATMRAYLFRPHGDGPFPLAVVNHGSEQNAIDRTRMGMPVFRALTDWLMAHGYAVILPQRPGHGETGGRYLEDQGRCSNADFVGSGEATANSIAATIDFMTRQPFIKPGGVIVIGNSAGGWGALALAARNPANVRAVVSFAGGRGGRNRGHANNNCSADELVAAAGEFGRRARIPTLWLYAENDSYFPPELSKRMAEAYRSGGGNVEFMLLPPVGAEGHLLIQHSSESWQPAMQGFLAGLR